MLSDIGMVRRALICEVKSHFQPVRFPGLLDEPPEILQRTQLRVYSLVPALLRTDCPWAAGVRWTGHRGAVLALAMAAPNRMDRRQVENVKPHVSDFRKPGLQVAESTVRARRRPSRAADRREPGKRVLYGPRNCDRSAAKSVPPGVRR